MSPSFGPRFRRPAIEVRRANIERVRRSGVHETKNLDRILIEGTGDVRRDIHFNVRFIERPVPSFAGEMEHGQEPRNGNFPGVSVVVVRWITEGPGDAATQRFYVGAEVAIETWGLTSQKMWVHLKFEGRALTNPTVPQIQGDLGETL